MLHDHVKEDDFFLFLTKRTSKCVNTFGARGPSLQKA